MRIQDTQKYLADIFSGEERLVSLVGHKFQGKFGDHLIAGQVLSADWHNHCITISFAYGKECILLIDEPARKEAPPTARLWLHRDWWHSDDFIIE